jgi:hypothetical protein
MSIEVRMQMTLNQANATEHLLKTLSRLGMMLPHVVLGEMINPEEDGYPVFRIIIRIVGDKQIFRIEVVDEDEDA